MWCCLFVWTKTVLWILMFETRWAKSQTTMTKFTPRYPNDWINGNTAVSHVWRNHATLNTHHPPPGAQGNCDWHSLVAVHSITSLISQQSEGNLFFLLIPAGVWEPAEESPSSQFLLCAKEGEITALIQCLSDTNTSLVIHTVAAVPSLTSKPASSPNSQTPPRIKDTSCWAQLPQNVW